MDAESDDATSDAHARQHRTTGYVQFARRYHKHAVRVSSFLSCIGEFAVRGDYISVVVGLDGPSDFVDEGTAPVDAVMGCEQPVQGERSVRRLGAARTAVLP